MSGLRHREEGKGRPPAPGSHSTSSSGLAQILAGWHTHASASATALHVQACQVAGLLGMTRGPKTNVAHTPTVHEFISQLIPERASSLVSPREKSQVALWEEEPQRPTQGGEAKG